MPRFWKEKTCIWISANANVGEVRWKLSALAISLNYHSPPLPLPLFLLLPMSEQNPDTQKWTMKTNPVFKAEDIFSSKVKVMSRILCRGVCCSFCVILLLSLSCTDYWKRLLEHATWWPLFVFVFYLRLSFVFFVFVSPTWWEEVARLVATWGDRAQGEILAEGHRHTGGGSFSISIRNISFN